MNSLQSASSTVCSIQPTHVYSRWWDRRAAVPSKCHIVLENTNVLAMNSLHCATACPQLGGFRMSEAILESMDREECLYRFQVFKMICAPFPPFICKNSQKMWCYCQCWLQGEKCPVVHCIKHWGAWHPQQKWVEPTRMRELMLGSELFMDKLACPYLVRAVWRFKPSSAAQTFWFLFARKKFDLGCR